MRFVSTIVLSLLMLSCGAAFNLSLPKGDTVIVSYDHCDKEIISYMSVDRHSLLEEPRDPERENFFFSGWYSEPWMATLWNFDSSTVSEDMTLYAKWTEDFDSSEKPQSQTLSYGSNTYRFYTPWNYDKPYNAERTYPLVIGLHGSTTLTDHYHITNLVTNEEYLKDFPCFYLAPNNSNKSFKGDAAQWIREVIHRYINNPHYPIDRDRIYIMGFSMGAQGCYYLAQDLYDDYGYLTAAMIPAEGGSNHSYLTSTEVHNKISIWIHYGSESYDQTSTYNYTKNLECNAGAVETEETGSITYTNWDGTVLTHDIETKTLTLGGMEFLKMSKYIGMGHSDKPVYEDPYLWQWLFYQSRSKR